MVAPVLNPDTRIRLSNHSACKANPMLGLISIQRALMLAEFNGAVRPERFHIELGVSVVRAMPNDLAQLVQVTCSFDALEKIGDRCVIDRSC